VLSVLDRPIPAHLQPMAAEAVERHWQAYQETHPPPPVLPRGRTPVLGDG